MEKSQEWIAGLNLKPHPEGGFYNEVYRSQVTVEPSCLPDGFSGKRHISTSIYYLLRAGEKSVLHRLLSDEIWYFHAGDPLTIVMLDQDKPKQVTLGSDVSNGQLLQFAIPAGTWFGAFVPNPGNYALCSCQVSPGFDFDDFEIGMRAELINMFPSCRTEIEMLTNI
jgi:predicted cupin superfamily sugar epimerase